MTATLAPAHQAGVSYRVPPLLAGIDLVDLLELCGSTTATAAALGLSQPTVSRRYRSLASDLGLRRWGQSGPQQLLYGDTTCLRLLRRACQWHRLEAGVLRLAANPWQGVLLEGLPGDSRLPLRFRQPAGWRRLLEAAIIDAAVLSSHDLNLLHPELLTGPEAAVIWGVGRLLPLGHWPLGLLLPTTNPLPPERQGEVLLPSEAAVPGMADFVRRRGWRCLHPGQRCQTPAEWANWLQQEQRPALASVGWAHRLAPLLPDWRWWRCPDDGQEQLWLLLHPDLRRHHPLLAELPERLRCRISSVAADLEAWSGGEAAATEHGWGGRADRQGC